MRTLLKKNCPIIICRHTFAVIYILIACQNLLNNNTTKLVKVRHYKVDKVFRHIFRLYHWLRSNGNTKWGLLQANEMFAKLHVRQEHKKAYKKIQIITAVCMILNLYVFVCWQYIPIWSCPALFRGLDIKSPMCYVRCTV